jgi:transposase InsO family protein
MCRQLRVSESGYHRWRNRRGQHDQRKRENEGELVTLVRRLHRKHPSYGRPRLHELVRLAGYAVGANRLRRIMLELGVSGRSGRKPLRRESQPTNSAPAPNLLKRRFASDRPNQVWTGDITEFQVGQGRVRLAVVIDLFARRVVGWKLDARMKTSLVLGALQSAVRLRRPSKGLIFHSDQGVQYTSARFKQMLRVLGMRQSMSRRGNCWDNAPTESFFATLKKEIFHGQLYRTCAELSASIARYIKRYNNVRLHTTLGLRSPRDYELQHRA